MIELMGHFTAIGMRTSVTDPKALVINTCAGNDTKQAGSYESWVWCNPTNRVMLHQYKDLVAVSVEALWQGTKIFKKDGEPDTATLAGDWRRGKARRPIGAYAGPNKDLIRTPGEARRKIYIPAYKNLIEVWMKNPDVSKWVAKAVAHKGPVFLRDFDTGRGIDRNGPMSHAWLLATYLNALSRGVLIDIGRMEALDEE